MRFQKQEILDGAIALSLKLKKTKCVMETTHFLIRGAASATASASANANARASAIATTSALARATADASASAT
eukprot:3427707-Karenia_brevis.AAC.1